MSEWRPIDTAPKDRRILLWSTEYTHVVGRWIRNRWQDDDGRDIDFGIITHWMPLPEPPTTGPATTEYIPQ